MISHVFTHPLQPTNPKHAIQSDPQRHKIYAMEREFYGMAVNTHVKRKDLNEMSGWLCNKWRVKHPKITLIRDKKFKSFGYADEELGVLLNVAHDGDNYSTLIHELAHWIKDIRFGTHDEDHGPVFVGVYRSLMASAKLLPTDCFDLLAKRYDVKIGSTKVML